MKKKVFVLGILLLTIFSMTGCVFNKAKETTKKTDSGDGEIKLYSDDKKLVFTNGDSKLVFYYEGEKITGYHMYVDYKNNKRAKQALKLIEKSDKVSKVYTKGKYVVIEYKESEFKNLTVSDVKRAYEYLKEATK